MYHLKLQGKTRALLIFGEDRAYVLQLVSDGWAVIDAMSRELVGKYPGRKEAILAMEKRNCNGGLDSE